MIQTKAQVSQFLRFIVAGTANTLLSLIIYQLALFAFHYAVSYAIAYSAGIGIAYYAYAKHVFHTPMAARALGMFAMFYLLSLLAGSLVNAVFVEQFGLHARVAIFATVAVTLPVNYLGSKWSLAAFSPRAAVSEQAAERRK